MFNVAIPVLLKALELLFARTFVMVTDLNLALGVLAIKKMEPKITKIVRTEENVMRI